jgi:integrase
MWLELELSERKLFSKKGNEYTYWEAGFTVGFDPGAGKQIQRSIIGKTQKKVV